MAEMILGLLLHLWPAILVPMVPLAFIRRAGRIAFFLLGIALFFGIGFLQGPQGPDSYGLIIPFYGLALSLAAVLAELPAIFIRRLRGRRAADSDDMLGHP